MSLTRGGKAIPFDVDGLSGWTADAARFSILSAFVFETPRQARRFATYVLTVADENGVSPFVSVVDKVVVVNLTATATVYLNRKLIEFAALITSTHNQHAASQIQFA